MTVVPVTTASELIERLGLSRHPEGGWYRETWRAEPVDSGRESGTAIFFLLENGQRSHWHRVDATEIWLWHAGSPLCLRTAVENVPGSLCETRLGGDILNGQHPQVVIPPDRWQAAEADLGWALVSCVVSPGFRFDGFTLAPPDWQPL